MSEHTKEPWKASQRAIAGTVDIYIGDYLNGRIERIGDVLTVSNARRIVACVNACAGLPQDALDGGWTSAGISAYAKKLEQQRDELLAALKRCRFDSLNMTLADLEFCQAAIAKAEAQHD